MLLINEESFVGILWNYNKYVKRQLLSIYQNAALQRTNTLILLSPCAWDL